MEVYEGRKLIKYEVFEQRSSTSNQESMDGCGKYP